MHIFAEKTRRMRKLFCLIIVFMQSLLCVANEEIELQPTADLSTDHRNERPAFTPKYYAALVSDTKISIIADRLSTFTVSVFSADSGAPLYQGATVNGVLHLTDSLSSGSYYITVENDGMTYTGQFVIED